MKHLLSVFKVSLDFSLIDFKTKYSGNIIGPLWIVINPLMLFSAYFFIYTYIYKLKDPSLDTQSYVLHMVSGLTVFLFFSESLSSATQALRANVHILKNTSFPVIIFPTKAFINCCINFFVSFSIIFLICIILGFQFNPFSLFAVLFLLITFIYGCTLPISIISLAVKDLSQVISFLNLIIMLATPIAFTMAQVPSSIKGAVLLNPLASYTIAIQNILVHGIPLSMNEYLKLISISSTTLLAGSWLFLKGKKIISSYV